MQQAGTGDRMSQLRAMLEKQPRDTFLLYGLALEHKKRGESAEAVRRLDEVIAIDSGYCYAYYQKGQILETTGDTGGARRVYQEGIEAAVRKGDAHARQELEVALDMVG